MSLSSTVFQLDWSFIFTAQNCFLLFKVNLNSVRLSDSFCTLYLKELQALFSDNKRQLRSQNRSKLFKENRCACFINAATLLNSRYLNDY